MAVAIRWAAWNRDHIARRVVVSAETWWHARFEACVLLGTNPEACELEPIDPLPFGPAARSKRP